MSSWDQVARRVRVPLGFAFAALYLWLAQPAGWSLMSGATLVVAGLLVRGSASGHVQKNEQLATSGPYAYTRNPLYLGSLLLGIGFVIAARSVWIGVALAAMLLLVYLPVIRSEEQFLTQRFPEFSEYSRQVPRLWPRLRAFGGNRGSFSWDLYWKHREYNATLGSAAIIAVLLAKLFRTFR